MEKYISINSMIKTFTMGHIYTCCLEYLRVELLRVNKLTLTWAEPLEVILFKAVTKY